MQWLWTWGGRFFGYREGDVLRTYDGRHVGRFEGNEVYDRHGHYLGEIIREENRLIRNRSKAKRTSSFTPVAKASPAKKLVDFGEFTPFEGYEDFPAPNSSVFE